MGDSTGGSSVKFASFRKVLVILVILAFFAYTYDYLAAVGTTFFSPSLSRFALISRSQAQSRPRPRPREPFKSFIQVPELNSADKYTVHSIYASLGRGEIRTMQAKNWVLAQLTAIVQRQLEELEYVQDCNDVVTLFCGYGGGTGLASQVLHRQICAMLSYVFGIPLIHNEGSWTYKKPWSEAFERVGSPCKESKTHTLQVIAYEHYSTDFLSGNLSLLFNERGCEQNCTLEYPFKHGLSVPKVIHDLIHVLHEDPFMWWIGEFTKYMLRIKTGSETEGYVATWRQRLFHGNETRPRPVIGMHIRRTDKISEAKLYGTGKYFHLAAEIMKNETTKSGGGDDGENSTATVFIASDAAQEVLLDARTNFSSSDGYRWSIIGVEDQLTTYNQTDRSQNPSALDEILRDVFILVEECDYVICTLSSGVCQLVLQLMSSKYADGPSRIKSLDLQLDETIVRWWAKVVFPV